MGEISWADFDKINLRVGTILTVSDFPNARKPAYQLQIDFGKEIGILKSSAQITKKYDKTELLGTQVVAIINFPKKQIANFMSECLVLGAVEGDEVTLLSPNKEATNGLRIL